MFCLTLLCYCIIKLDITLHCGREIQTKKVIAGHVKCKTKQNISTKREAHLGKTVTTHFI